VDDEFTGLPLAALADAALSGARRLGAEHADLRVERVRSRALSLRDTQLETTQDEETTGIAVRVVVDGTWGFAAGRALDPAAAAQLTERAVAVARACRAANAEPVELAPEPTYPDATWVSAYTLDPFAVPTGDAVALLAARNAGLLAAAGVVHADGSMHLVKEQKFYADLTGTTTTQQRVRVAGSHTALWVDPACGRFETLRTLAPPVGRGYEWFTGSDSSCWDWDAELAELPALLVEKAHAPSVAAGHYDLVIDPSNLWLTIHESVGHATELDRALGYEANYAGTSFATVDRLGTLQYGSPLMTVTGDRTAEHGLASAGFDDEGVATQTWDLVRDGVLVGYQLDRRMAARLGLERSNGCAFADAPYHVPIQRMANVSLRPAADGPSTEDLIGAVDRGIYVVGDRSWSIDMQRYNFQFTGQRFYAITGGRISGPLRDVAYQATTTDFWGSLAALGGPQTYVLGGALNCGKGQPGQVAPVSHGCPSAIFRGVRVLNTVDEAGR